MADKAHCGVASIKSEPSPQVNRTPLFNDKDTSDITLVVNNSKNEPVAVLYMHKDVLRQSTYFDAAFSDRWLYPDKSIYTIRCGECDGSSHMIAFESLYVHLDALRVAALAWPFQGVLGLIKVAAEFQLTDCLRACLEYVEAIPWSEEEERNLLEVVHGLALPEEVLGLTFARLSICDSAQMPVQFRNLLSSAVLEANARVFREELLLNLENTAEGTATRTTKRQILLEVYAGLYGDVQSLILGIYGKGARHVQACFKVYSIGTRRGHTITEYDKPALMHLLESLEWLTPLLFECESISDAFEQWLASDTCQGTLHFIANQIYQEYNEHRKLVPHLEGVLKTTLLSVVKAFDNKKLIASARSRASFLRIWLRTVALFFSSQSSPPPLSQEDRDRIRLFICAMVCTLPPDVQLNIFSLNHTVSIRLDLGPAYKRFLVRSCDKMQSAQSASASK